MKMPSAQDINRVKGLGFLHNRGTETFSGRLVNKNGVLTVAQLAALRGKTAQSGAIYDRLP
jgi:hypothetical protein